MKKRTCRLALLLALLLALAGCGASAPSAGSAPNGGFGAETEAPEAMEDSMAQSESAPEQPAPDPAHPAKRIYRGSLEMETTAFDDAVRSLTDLVEQCGGYFENSALYDYRSGYRTGEYTVRVPVERYRAFYDQAGQLCHVTWRNESTEDVTRQYFDTDGRLKTQETKLTRLQELLAQAQSMEDIITLESAISDTEYAIEQLSGELRYLDDQVSHSTVTITLNEVYKLSGERELPQSFGDRLGQSLSGGLRNFLDGLEDFVIWLAYNWTWLVLVIAVGAAAVTVLRKRPRGEKHHWFRKKKHDQNDDQ